LQDHNMANLEKITVIVGPNAPWLKRLHSQASEMSVLTQVLSGVHNMAELMTTCDLAIGAGGSTTWERCSLGVPSILVSLAKNQAYIADAINKVEAAYVINDLDAVSLSIRKFIKKVHLVDILQEYSKKCALIADGQGVGRVVSELDCNYE